MSYFLCANICFFISEIVNLRSVDRRPDHQNAAEIEPSALFLLRVYNALESSPGDIRRVQKV